MMSVQPHKPLVAAASDDRWAEHVTIRPYREEDWPAVCALHDRARRDELQGLPDNSYVQ